MVISNRDSPEATAATTIQETETDCRYDGETAECENLVDRLDEDEDSSRASPTAAEVVIPPDGGWGWMVVFGSFMCNLVVDGVIFSFGTMIEPIAEEFEVTNPNVSLVGSLMSGFYLIAGPFVSAIANRYGFRVVTVVGAVLAAIGFVLSNFATSVPFLCFTYGVLGGIGFGFIYAPSIITIGFYFEKWRQIATGIAVCGSGIGTFAFAPIGKLLITHSGWRGALLCQAAITLTCALFGALFRPLKATKLKDIEPDTENSEKIMDPSKLPLATRLKMEEAMKLMRKGSLDNDHQHSIPRLFGVKNNSDYPTISDVYHTISIPNRQTADKVKRLSVPFIPEAQRFQKKIPLLDIDRTKPLVLPKRSRTTSETKDPREVVRPLYRDDIFFGASLARLPQYTSRTSVEYNLAITRLPTKNDVEEEVGPACQLCPEAFRRVLGTMLDVSLMKSHSFLILAVGGFFTMMGFFVPYMYLVDRAGKSGIDNMTAVWLVATIGIANTVGRIMYGVITSFPCVDALFVNNVALTIGGLATMFSGLSMSVEYQFAYCVVFGLCISCFASLRSIIVVDLLGLENLTNAFGLLLLFQGIAAIIGAPLAGAFMQATGSHNACFYLSGGMIFLSAVMCYPLNWVNRREKKRNEIRTREERSA
ncbi:unnamed protein product [Phaedon cochleariae]|uniref:Major facilitator superfamily (MFS) profile domain-containing protein n=1 Tax=Phaedon cochleariae TaxID=80249 RepID=A0A9P0DTQ8_PHACE|nr:unnamed protein product [Phaedon cochleariae]